MTDYLPDDTRVDLPGAGKDDTRLDLPPVVGSYGVTQASASRPDVVPLSALLTDASVKPSRRRRARKSWWQVPALATTVLGVSVLAGIGGAYLLVPAVHNPVDHVLRVGAAHSQSVKAAPAAVTSSAPPTHHVVPAVRPSQIIDLVTRPAPPTSSAPQVAPVSPAPVSPAPAPVPSSAAPSPSPTGASPTPTATSPSPTPTPTSSSPSPTPTPTPTSSSPSPTPTTSSPSPTPTPSSPSPTPTPSSPAPTPTPSSPAPTSTVTTSSVSPSPSTLTTSASPTVSTVSPSLSPSLTSST